MVRSTAARVFALTIFFLVVGFANSEEPKTPRIVEIDETAAPVVDHREDPVDPPSTPVTREMQARSQQAEVSSGLVTSVQVNVDALQNNIVGDAANEPTIAIDPTDPNNIVIAWRQFGTITSDFREAGVSYSHDGGLTWTFPGPLDPGQFRSDPVLAADNNGDFYYYSLSSVTTAEYFVSTDKGVKWTAPISAPGGDKNWHTIDTGNGLGDGHIYALWNSQFTCCAAGTDFTRSTDSALSFGGPYILPSHPKWGTDAVGPDGELYIVGTELSGTGHLILRSDDSEDAGVTPSFPQVTSIDMGGITDIGGTPNPGGLLGQVWVAVDGSTGPSRGNVYVLASINPPGTDPLDVHFIRSVDGGLTWSPPLRVNDDATNNDAYQWFGTMSVSPEGRIDVVWNDTRNGPDTMSRLYYAYSIDAGLTFSSGLEVSPAFDSTVGFPVQNKIGDYYHMISQTDTAALAYSATFNGEQDVYFVRVGDCNANGTHDAIDISLMTVVDANLNGIPDACEPDCNDNGIPDDGDISSGTSVDCNGNGAPDECDIGSGESIDCNGNGMADECELLFDLETDPGFTVGASGDRAKEGLWIRVDPNGTAAQPESDHTSSPGAVCFVTGQGAVSGGLDDADVDGGETTLISPAIDLGGQAEPWLGYWRWYSNNAGGFPGADTFAIDISNDDGQNWFSVEIVGPAGAETVGGWFFHTFRVSDIVPPTADVRLRFVASDLQANSTVEAAIDDLVMVDCAACAMSTPIEVADLTLARSGVTADLSWGFTADASEFNVYRGTQSDASDLICLTSGIVGTSISDDGAVPSSGSVLYYVVTAVNCAGESTLVPQSCSQD